MIGGILHQLAMAVVSSMMAYLPLMPCAAFAAVFYLPRPVKPMIFPVQAIKSSAS